MSTSIPPHAPDAGMRLTARDVLAAEGGWALRASRCTVCGQSVFPASDICPFCLAESNEPLALAGVAKLYSFTRVHVAPKAWTTPYALCYADFPGGLRLLGKLSPSASSWQADQPVRLHVVPDDSGEEPGFRYFFGEAHT
jgi:uncharacterized OB-fold protein